MVNYITTVDNIGYSAVVIIGYCAESAVVNARFHPPPVGCFWPGLALRGYGYAYLYA